MWGDALELDVCRGLIGLARVGECLVACRCSRDVVCLRVCLRLLMRCRWTCSVVFECTVCVWIVGDVHFNESASAAGW